jgi:hypothetical protein
MSWDELLALAARKRAERMPLVTGIILEYVEEADYYPNPRSARLSGRGRTHIGSEPGASRNDLCESRLVDGMDRGCVHDATGRLALRWWRRVLRWVLLAVGSAAVPREHSHVRATGRSRCEALRHQATRIASVH